MYAEKEPIFALATPRGRSALAVFRISGKGSHKIIKKISTQKKWNNCKAKLNYLLDNNKEKIDKTLTTFFNAPQTYTGENMVEISCHGGVAVINKVAETLAQQGLRIAEPGEFTKRALKNDKLDITQAESISDIVNSETEKQRIIALKNLDGELSTFLKKISKKITKLLADVEALIDFSDEELPTNMLKKIKEQNKNIICLIKESLLRSKMAKPIRDGFIIAILGSPNTGKSSFVNYISGRNVSIVTEIPGTTTDSLEASIEIDGYKFRLIDTAGIRKKVGKIEQIGIKKAIQTAKTADLNIVFLDKNEKNKYLEIPNKIFVRSKEDIRRTATIDKKTIKISSKTGYGIKKLIHVIKKELIKTDNEKTPMFSRERQIQKMKKCLEILETLNFNYEIDLVAEDIRSSLKEVSGLYEKFDIEKVLDIIFNDFCIGK